MKTLKRLFAWLMIILLVAVIITVSLIIYIRPSDNLDLNYSNISIADKILENVQKRSLDIELTQREVNNLIKKNLIPEYSEDITIKGADFQLRDGGIIALLHIKYRGVVDAQIVADYDLTWNKPNLQLVPVSLAMKKIKLPVQLLEPINVPIELPADDIVSIKTMNVTTVSVKLKLGLNRLDWLGW